MKKTFLILLLTLPACSQNVKQEDIQMLNGNIVRINAKLTGIQNQIDQIKDELSRRQATSKNLKKHREEFEASVNSRLEILESRVHNLMPIYQQK